VVVVRLISYIAIAMCLIAGTRVYDAYAGNTSPRYTPRELVKIRSHECRTEDSFMFVPARRIKAGVSWPAGSHDVVYCVQIDNAYKAGR